MAKQVIGQSISDAIDWAQDRLRTTRPLAESVLFSFLKDKKIVQCDEGFIFESSDDEHEDDAEMQKRSRNSLKRKAGHRPRFNFGNRKYPLSERRMAFRAHMKSMGYADESDEMHAGLHRLRHADPGDADRKEDDSGHATANPMRSSEGIADNTGGQKGELVDSDTNPFMNTPGIITIHGIKKFPTGWL